MTLKIVGNPTNDRICFADTGETIERQGGICNILRHLSVSCDIHATAPTDASIMIYEKAGRRSSFVEWNREILNQDYKPTLWSHISYLDCVDVDINALKSPFVSADLCWLGYTREESSALFDQMQYLDWLIITQENLTALGVLPRVKRGVIVRGKYDITVYAKNRISSYPNRHIQVRDPVGAGDYFVARFLSLVQDHEYDSSKEAALMANCIDFAISCLRRQNG